MRIVDSFADESLDFALVDGSLRDHCAAAVLSKLAAGGLLIIDNAHWYLDHVTKSPASRYTLGPGTDVWADVARRIANWRMIWTSSGVSDTGIWFKPTAW